jgi:hypothetical protein
MEFLPSVFLGLEFSLIHSASFEAISIDLCDLSIDLCDLSIALCDLSFILPKSQLLPLHYRHATSSAPPHRLFLPDLFWVSVLAHLKLDLSSSVRSTHQYVSPPSSSTSLLPVAAFYASAW